MDASRPEELFGENTMSLAGFYLGDGLYGIDIMKIKEVIQASPYEVRRVPHAPAMIEGVIELRGVVIPVMDLRSRFKLPERAEVRARAKYIVVSVEGKILALRVDRILGEVRVDRDSVRPAPALLEGANLPGEGFLAGVTRAECGLIFVLDLVGLTVARTGDVPSASPGPGGAS